MADLWTFPEGTVGHSESVKGYRVDASDGTVGKVEWADYAPGESYLVVAVGHKQHHLVRGPVRPRDARRRFRVALRRRVTR
jgi:hypothetical protein